MPCSLTISARRSGIIINTPINPPAIARMATRPMSRSYPINRIAGIVKTTPAETESAAEPVVCTMLFSRMVERPSQRKIVIDRTAMGIDALTVSPILSARYTFDAPKMSPSTTPSAMARRVSSAGACVAGM